MTANRIKPTEKYAQFQSRIAKLEEYITAQANNRIEYFEPFEVIDRVAHYKEHCTWKPFVLLGRHPEDTTCGVVHIRTSKHALEPVRVSIFNHALIQQIEELRKGHAYRNAEDRVCWDRMIAQFEEWIARQPA